VSELNELIASSSVHAYNSGIEQGKQLELDRIVELVEKARVITSDQKYFLIQAIKGEK
jgi:hypothetical protein